MHLSVCLKFIDYEELDTVKLNIMPSLFATQKVVSSFAIELHFTSMSVVLPLFTNQGLSPSFANELDLVSVTAAA